jgi:hypothetical protein
MKTIITVTFRKTAVLMLSIILGSSGCGNRQSGAANEKSQTIETGTVEKPDMDIFTAALLGNLKAINNHIKAGTDLNQKDEYGSTPLIIATTFGKTDVAIALIDAGARKEITNALLEKGADKTLKNAYGSTPYESVTAPYEAVKPIYDQIAKDLGPLGLKLDYDQIQKNRLIIAEMLK